jgi:hypothetical protein
VFYFAGYHNNNTITHLNEVFTVNATTTKKAAKQDATSKYCYTPPTPVVRRVLPRGTKRFGLEENCIIYIVNFKLVPLFIKKIITTIKVLN